jgi:hypothetical protein
MNRYDKIDPEVKQKWLEALRSGKYKQGRYGLRHTVDNTDLNGEKYDAFCCLGVLCDVVQSNAWTPKKDAPAYWLHNNESSTTVGYDIRDSIGLASAAIDNLIHLNDSFKKDFKEIADWIEENL